MATWTALYIHTSDMEKLTALIMELSQLPLTGRGAFPVDLDRAFLFEEKALPNYLAIGQTQPQWITIRHNSFNRLHNWCETLSRDLHTRVIAAMGQSVSDAYYFALYENGEQKREIEVCYSDDSDRVNTGKPFVFEGQQPGERHEYDGEVSWIFDFDSIETYSRHFGLEAFADEETVQWNILRGRTNEKTVDDFVQENTQRLQKKPWWKYW